MENAHLHALTALKDSQKKRVQMQWAKKQKQYPQKITKKPKHKGASLRDKEAIVNISKKCELSMERKDSTLFS